MIRISSYKYHLKFLLLVALIHSFLFTCAQLPTQTGIQIDLNEQNSNTSKEYIARDQVTFNPGTTTGGYQFDGNNGRMIGRIDPYQIFTNTPVPTNQVPDADNYYIETSLPVGAIPSQINISPTGAAVYTIPIDVPKGTNNLQPNLSVVYNSQSGNGLLGWGWNLSGLSVITRTGRTIYHDGKVTGIQFNSEDRFLLDGKRLMQFSGGYGSNGSEYRTESNQIEQIFSYGTQVSGPQRFEVITSDKYIIDYGYENNSSYPLSESGEPVLYWYINKITDQFGNYMTFEYRTYNDNIYLKSIKYTGNSNNNLQPYNRIDFTYEERADKSEKFINGVRVFNSLLLTSIKCFSYDLLYRKYDFKYFNRTISDVYVTEAYSFLFKIDETSKGQKLNSTILNYGPTNSSNPLPLNTTAIDSTDDYITGDFDGNGETDIVGFFKENNVYSYYRLYLNINGVFQSPIQGALPSGFYPVDPNNPLFNGTKTNDIKENNSFTYWNWTRLNISEHSPFPISNNPVSSDNPVISRVSTTDFNGDGKEDLILYHANSYGAYSFNGTNFTQIGNTFTYNNDHYYTAGDFDGDGKSDMLVFNKTPVNNIYSWIMYLFDNPNSPLSGTISLAPNITGVYFYPCDNNADGKGDILAVSNNNTILTLRTNILSVDENNKVNNISISEADNFGSSIIVKMYMGDFNGDNSTDLLINKITSGYNNDWSYYFAAGAETNCYASFQSPIPMQPTVLDQYLLSKYKYKETIGDFNGDGLSDIVQIHEVYENNDEEKTFVFDVYFSKGDGTFFPKKTFTRYNNLDFDFDDDAHVFVGDFDGNGIHDILIQRKEKLFFQKLDNCREEYLLEKVVDGMGNVTEVNYTSLPNADNTVFAPDNSNQYNFPIISNSTPPLYVVKNILIPDGIGGQNGTYYKYSGILIHSQGRGFLGFEGFEKKNNNIKEISNYTINTQFYYPELHSVETKNINDDIISSSVYTYNYQIFNPTYLFGKRFFQYINNVDESLLYGYVHNNTISSYDLANCNLMTQTKNYNDEVTVQTQYAYDNTFIHKVHSSTTTTSYAANTQESPFSQSETYAYDSNTGVLTQHVKNGVTADYEYYPLGSLKKETISSTGLSTKITEYEYDPTGRFVTKTIDPADNEGTATYNLARGLLLTQTDINNRTTHYQYDNFDNLTKTIYPDGTFAEKTLSWNTDANMPGILYSSTEKATKKPDINTFFDVLSRAVKVETKDAFNRNLQSYTTYNNNNQVIVQSEPYFDNETPLTTSYTYYLDGKVENISTAGIKTTHYGYVGTTTNITNTLGQVQQTFQKQENAVGQITQYTDAGGIITYRYYNMGLPKEIISNGTSTSFEYDNYGRQRFLHDPDAGTTEYQYNNYGELEYQIDARGNRYDMDYDILGRITSKQNTTEGLNYTYTYNAPNNKGALLSETLDNSNNSVSYTYDNLGRLSKVTKNIDALHQFEFSYTYDNDGELVEKKYPSGFTIENIYNGNGYLTQVNNKQNSQPIWVLEDANSQGKPTQVLLGNGLSTYHNYDSYHYLTSIKTGLSETTGLVQNYSYQFTPEWGRPEYRINGFGDEEYFGYDEDNLLLNRLTSVTVTNNSAKNLAMTYHANGNILSKTGIGAYTYNGAQPHAVTKVNPNSLIPETIQDIDYTSFNKVSQITEGDYRLDFTYGIDQERTKTEFYDNDVLQKTKYFAGEYELETTSQDTRELNYIAGPMGLAAILVKDNANPSGKLYYIHTDHLGSITEITDDQGTLQQRMAYDAWGNRSRLDNNGGGYLFDRGYTGHEHLDAFKLINMNGRLYDPILGRMLSPDNYVQTPTNSQNFNRYSYCMNNPMVYVDPSGEIFWLFPVFGLAALGYYTGSSLYLKNFNIFEKKWWKDQTKTDAWKAGLIGAEIGASIGGGLCASGAFGSDAMKGLGVFLYHGRYSTSKVGWDVVSQGLISADINFVSEGFSHNWKLRENINSISESALVSFIAGAAGAAYGRLTNHFFYQDIYDRINGNSIMTSQTKHIAFWSPSRVFNRNFMSTFIQRSYLNYKTGMDHPLANSLAQTMMMAGFSHPGLVGNMENRIRNYGTFFLIQTLNNIKDDNNENYMIPIFGMSIFLIESSIYGLPFDSPK